MFYIDVYDLIFNGADGCTLLKDKPATSYVKIIRTYDIGRGKNIYRAYYKNVFLGATIDFVSIGFLKAITNSLKGKGTWLLFNFDKGDVYRPFSVKDYNTVKELGMISF